MGCFHEISEREIEREREKERERERESVCVCVCRSCDFLPKVFELFPDCDFCIISVPHVVPEFPLLQQFVVSVSWSPSLSL